jgi:hypothetical protein
MSESSDARRAGGTPAPRPQFQRLGALVGRWRSEDHIVGEVPASITGTDVYEWLAGGFSHLHHVAPVAQPAAGRVGGRGGVAGLRAGQAMTATLANLACGAFLG